MTESDGFHWKNEGQQGETNAVVVTLASNDRDLADLLRHLLRYDEVTRWQLLHRAEEWLRVVGIGGVTGADSAQLTLCRSQTDSPRPENLSALPK